MREGRVKPRRHRSRAERGGLCLAVGTALVLAIGSGAVRAAEESGTGAPPWSRFYLPASDGILGLRYGMDRTAASDALRGRGFEARAASSPAQMRLVGKVLGETAELSLFFLGGGGEPGGERLARIEVHWRFDGSLRVPRRIYESLCDLLGQRYGPAVRVEEESWPAVDAGGGHRGRAHAGPQTLALAEIRGIRKEVYRVDLRLEFPPWSDRL